MPQESVIDRPDLDLQLLELRLLVDAIEQRYDYDFRHYAQSSLKRRVLNRVHAEGLDSISDLIPRILHDVHFFDRFLVEMSVTVTKMFRNPSVFKTLRERVLPILATYSRINIWHAGCATGEEVYSMAIMLAEEGLLDRTQIYATDYNNNSLDTAKKAIYPIGDIQEFSSNYLESGGLGSLSDFYHAQYGSAKFSDELSKRITFAHHNLVADKAFGEMHLILCRNVLIYFDQHLQNGVLTMLRDSTADRGFLVLGDRETLDYTKVADDFREYLSRSSIYQKERVRQL